MTLVTKRRYEMTTAEKIEIAEKINATFGGRVWCPSAEKENTHVRVYAPSKGFILIKDNGDANIDGVGRNDFDEAKKACEAAGVEAKRF